MTYKKLPRCIHTGNACILSPSARQKEQKDSILRAKLPCFANIILYLFLPPLVPKDSPLCRLLQSKDRVQNLRKVLVHYLADGYRHRAVILFTTKKQYIVLFFSCLFRSRRRSRNSTKSVQGKNLSYPAREEANNGKRNAIA